MRAQSIFNDEHEGRHDGFFFYAVADKVLVGGKLRYMLFFDGDETFNGFPWP